MRVDRLGRLFEQKYGLKIEAAEYPPRKPTFPLPKVNFPTPSMERVEFFVRDNIDNLWQIPNKLFNILKACADSDAKNPKNEHEELAVSGFKFCKKVLSIVDYLKANRNTISVSDARKAMTELLRLINENRHSEDELKQFPHVSAIVFEVMPASKKYDRKIREQEYAKARKGLSRMASLIVTVIDQLNEWGGSTEQVAGRFDPEGAKLSEEEITYFIRHYGDKYSIPDRETWNLILDFNPDFEKILTRLVHGLMRGKIPRGADRLKPIIQNIIRRRQEATQTNLPALEQEKPGPNPLVLFEDEKEESEAWDAKMASKYNDLALSKLLRKGNL